MPWALVLAVAASILSITILAYVSRRRANRRNLQIMQQLADATTEGIVVAQGGRIVSANRGVAELCGVAGAQLIGQSVVGDLIDQPIEARGEAALRTASGTCVPVSVVRKRLSTGDEVYAIHDLSERRAVEKELQRQNRIL